jgi:hypothetical protein
MKKVIIAAAIFGAGLAALRRFAPAIHERAMSKCHQMMGKCGEMSSQHAFPGGHRLREHRRPGLRAGRGRGARAGRSSYSKLTANKQRPRRTT